MNEYRTMTRDEKFNEIIKGIALATVIGGALAILLFQQLSK